MNTPSVFDVNQSDFHTAVIERSHQELVLVDFWAPWCGPCRMLGPVLERLANETHSSFVLAKLNTDDNQQLAMHFQIRGIPAVKAFRNGQVVDEFVGAQPEPMVRQFVQRNSAPLRPQAMAPSGDPLTQAKNHLRNGRGADALTLLETLSNEEADRLRPLATLLTQIEQGKLTGQITVDGLYRDAAHELQRRHPETALYRLLTVLNQEEASRKLAVKAAMEAIVFLWKDNKPAVTQYTQILSGIPV